MELMSVDMVVTILCISRDGSIYKLNKTTGAIESIQNLTTDEMPYPARVELNCSYPAILK